MLPRPIHRVGAAVIRMPMKCAIVHNHPIHYKHLLFQELTRRGLDFEVIFAGSCSDIRHEKIELRPELYKSRIAFDGPYEAAPRAIRAMNTWRGLVEIEPDIVIISGYHAAECWAAWAWAAWHRRTTIMWYESNVFDYPKRYWYKESLKRLFIAQLDRAHVYGASNKAYLVQLGLSPERIDVKRAVANVQAFQTAPGTRAYSESRKKNLLYVGRLSEEKNVATLLRAISRAVKVSREELWTLEIVGTGPLKDELQGLSRSLCIEHLVQFSGYCPQAQLAQCYHRADLFILPSTREPWGLVALEAMLCRTPVAISTQCGCAEDLVNPETGWRFPPWTEEALSTILLELSELGSEDLRAMGNACYEIASGYSAPACAERILQSLRNLGPPEVAFAPGVGSVGT